MISVSGLDPLYHETTGIGTPVALHTSSTLDPSLTSIEEGSMEYSNISGATEMGQHFKNMLAKSSKYQKL